MTHHDPVRRMTEMNLHMYVVDLLGNCAAPDVMWWHNANGELRDEKTGAKLKRMGVKPGLPDFTILIPKQAPGDIAFLEIKGDGGTVSAVQKDFMARLRRIGCLVGVARTPEEACSMLVSWGAVRTQRSLE